MAYLNSYSHYTIHSFKNSLELATTLVWHGIPGQTVPTAGLGISIHQMGTKRLVLAELWQAECWQAVTEMEGKMHLPSHFVLGKKSMQITANALNQLIVFEELEGGKLAENCYYQ